MTITIEQMYEMQKELDTRIIREKGLEGHDLLPNTILALQVEIAELANEWRGFKHWSDRKEPKHGYEEKIDCDKCSGRGFWFNGNRVHCYKCAGTGEVTNPLLEEYVDCLHFFLSIARQLELEPHKVYVIDDELEGETAVIFTELLVMVARLRPDEQMNNEKIGYLFRAVFGVFISLGDQRLGFDFDQIAAAYMEKNKINHERQANGY